MELKYKQKYLKYKQKYLILRDKIIKPLHVNVKGFNFNDEFSNDVQKGIMKLELSHDLAENKIINKTFYDLVNKTEVIINDNLIKDPEDYLQYLLLNNKTELFNNYTIETSPIEISDLSNYIAIFDNLALTNNLATKLYELFKIETYSETFIQNCEQFINNKNYINVIDVTKKNVKDKSKNKISDEFKINDELKSEYLLEAVLIGFLPITQNKLIRYSVYNDNKIYTDDIKTELILLQTFCNQTKQIIHKLPKINDLVINKYLNDLVTVNENINTIFLLSINKLSDKDKQKLINVNVINDNKFIGSDDEIRRQLYLLYIDNIERVVFSMKEARDSYYIKEILDMNFEKSKIKNSSDKNNLKKNIFVTTDKILTFRCLINKIPVKCFNRSKIIFEVQSNLC